MEYSIDIIKKQIEVATKNVFKDKNDFDLSEIINLFLEVLKVPVDDKNLNLDDIDSQILNSYHKIQIEGVGLVDRKTYFSAFAKTEQFLRKISHLKDSKRYDEIKEKKQGLVALIKELELNPNNIKLDIVDIESIEGDDNYVDYLSRIYRFRNIDSHEIIPELPPDVFGKLIISFLVIYLHVTHKYKEILKVHVSNSFTYKMPSFNSYCDSIIDSFKGKMGRFIHLSSKENIKLSGSYVMEHKLNENFDSEEEEVNREGTVECLRESLIPEKRMIIWGEAGMGKSTTLEYLAYKDALNKKSDKSQNLPVYVQLGLLTDSNISLENYIYSKIGVDNSIGKKLLETGKLNLFLDGLNEVPRDSNNQLITLRQREIDNIIKCYKKTFIIITNRPQHINQFTDVPVFFIQKMTDKQIEDFVVKYSEGNKLIEDKIINAIKEDNRLKKIIKTPLMLSRLMEIVKSEGDIPPNEGLIIDRFIKSLYKREIVEKKDAKFNEKYIHNLLSHLAAYSIETKGANSAMTENEILNVFLKTKKEYALDIDILYVLDISCQLNIIERNDNNFVFSHESYQDYFNSEYERIILGV